MFIMDARDGLVRVSMFSLTVKFCEPPSSICGRQKNEQRFKNASITPAAIKKTMQVHHSDDAQGH
jgi:hypothetical protein